jgi:lysophospholipid acyltransferase (LPLAT)-like uncharacterized protein
VSPAAARRVIGPLVTLLASSWRIRLVNEERWRGLYEVKRPLVYLLWHEALLPLLWQHRRQGVAIVVSEARDGQYLNDLARSWGYRAVRGSSTRGGIRALLGAVRELQAGHSVAFTPDGPRGPCRELKPGVITAAQRGGGIIVPIHAEADRAWRLHSWDRFMIPQPLARVWITYGDPFEVEPGESGFTEGLERATASLAEISRTGACRDGAIAIG